MSVESNISVFKGVGQTRREHIKFNYTWNIQNFSRDRIPFGHRLNSPTGIFKTVTSSYEFELSLWKPHAAVDHYSLLIQHNITKPIIDGKVYILQADGKKTSERLLTCDGNGSVFRQLSFEKFCSVNVICGNSNVYIPNDTLTIVFEIIILEDIESSFQKICAVPSKQRESEISAYFGLLLAEQKFCDVTLAVGKTEFRAHKCILAARSAVFSAMFEHNFKEKEQDRVEIIDVKPEVLREMLQFIYTDKLDTLDELAKDLLIAADKYALERLKVMCEDKLCRSLTAENVVDMLILANQHNADGLQKEAIKFAYGSTKADFRSTMMNNPDVAVDVFRASMKTTK